MAAVRSRRIWAAVGALMMLALSSFGVVSAAQAAPNAPIFHPSLDGSSTADAQIEVMGQLVGAGQLVTVYLSNDQVSGAVYCEAVDIPGLWSCLPTAATLAFGANYLTATVTDETGTSEPSAPIVVTRTGEPDPDPEPDPEPVYPFTVDSPANGFQTTDATPTFSGTGPALGSVTVSEGGTALCTAAVAADETWTCDSAVLPTGEHTITVTATPTGAVALPSIVVGITIIDLPSPPATPPGGNGAPTQPKVISPLPQLPVLPFWTFSMIGADGGMLSRGQLVTLVATGLVPFSAVSVHLGEPPVALGATTVGADGMFSLGALVPGDFPLGIQRLAVSVTPPGEAASVKQELVTIVEAPAEEAVQAPREASAANATKPTNAELKPHLAGSTDRNDPASPSFLTTAIATLQRLLGNPAAIVTAGAGGLLLLLFVAFPAELLNATLSEQYERFARRIPLLRARVGWIERMRRWFSRNPIAGGIAVTAFASLAFGFADPGFGINLTSLRLVLSCAIALFVVGYLSSAITGLIVHQRWHVPTVIELKPLGLVLTVAGVVASRMLDFSPGFLIGLLLGVTIAEGATTAALARTALVRSGIMFGFAMAAWIGYSVVVAGGIPSNFAGLLATDTLVAVTTEALVALVIGMLPFQFLEGDALYHHAKWLWAASYAVVAAAFIAILVPAASGWDSLSGSIWTWVVGGFAILAVLVYLYFRFVAQPIPEVDPQAAEREPVSEST